MLKTTSTNTPTTLLRTLNLSFNLPIRGFQIRKWRGAFLEMAGWTEDLCHNHNGDDGVHYRYPMVQYRVYKGKAAIFAINEGVEAIQRILSTSDWKVRWDDQLIQLMVDDLRLNEQRVQLSEEMDQKYVIHQWLPFTANNYGKYQAAEGYLEKGALLQQLLRNHIVGCLKNLDCLPEQQVKVRLEDINLRKRVMYHEAKLMSFNVAFNANVALPTGLAIGKGVSLGFGNIRKIYQKDHQSNARQHADYSRKDRVI